MYCSFNLRSTSEEIKEAVQQSLLLLEACTFKNEVSIKESFQLLSKFQC